MELDLQFRPAGNITAATIGAQAPDCGPKAQPQLDESGEWVCVTTQSTGGGLLVLLVAAAAYWFYFRNKGKGIE